MAEESRVEESWQDIAMQLRFAVTKEMATDLRPKKFAEEVRDHLRYKEIPAPWNPSPLTKTGPYATGAAAMSVEVRQTRAANGRFLPAFVVYSLSPIMHFLEYGTLEDKPGGHSPWGPNTPTPIFAPFAHTALYYHGTMDDGPGDDL